ncbi:RAMP superfamily protein [Leptolyngbya sp. NK1-12]|uniref:RAMP superfamily protein n=2 Tax=Leptolyngbya sp. NK1-12 TaxID=2547451 RepID=A0AA96WL31_9CYAN|nr:RAMP superfamily protein [Leptolyngbya sp. NK1-12]
MYPYSGVKLITLLEQQHQARAQTGLFKKGTFVLQWRAKVGSFPHADVETLVSAGEPCGSWRPKQGRPEDKRNVGDNWEQFPELPLYGYIPGASIRGIVRAWANQRPDVKLEMIRLLGNQEGDAIRAGKIEFLDAFPEKPTKLRLDIVNPQEQFQVYHQGQGTPLSLYTLGDGQSKIPITVAIRGIPGKATETDVEQVWQWVQQALIAHGVGSRTASGYGILKPSYKPQVAPELRKPAPGFATKQLEFILHSQGNAGPNPKKMELRPSHWRGWLRSWLLRFFLGVMTPEDARLTVGELMGTLQAPDDGGSRKGLLQLKMTAGDIWGERSENSPYFYTWKGKISIAAPTDILNQVILPVIKFAATVGGVGRGWRRPLHIFVMKNNGKPAARGGYLRLFYQVKLKDKPQLVTKTFGVALNSNDWQQLYEQWQVAVQTHWANRFAPGQVGLRAEVFSPTSCAVYLVPQPHEEPIDTQNLEWITTTPTATRGEGMNLIYKSTYKGKVDVGGKAAGGSNAHCSWVSIKRHKIPKQQECQETVCLFMGERNTLREQFLQELANIPGSIRLFGVY